MQAEADSQGFVTELGFQRVHLTFRSTVSSTSREIIADGGRGKSGGRALSSESCGDNGMWCLYRRETYGQIRGAGAQSTRSNEITGA